LPGRGTNKTSLLRNRLHVGIKPTGYFVGLVAVVGVLVASWLALVYFFPAPPSKIMIATATEGSTGNEADQLPPFERPGHRTLGLGDQLCFAPMDKDPGDDNHDHDNNY